LTDQSPLETKEQLSKLEVRSEHSVIGSSSPHPIESQPLPLITPVSNSSLSPVSYMVSENNLDNVDVLAVDWLEDFIDIEGLCSSFKSSESD
jgi:hypothetical protein